MSVTSEWLGAATRPASATTWMGIDADTAKRAALGLILKQHLRPHMSHFAGVVGTLPAATPPRRW